MRKVMYLYLMGLDVTCIIHQDCGIGRFARSSSSSRTDLRNKS